MARSDDLHAYRTSPMIRFVANEGGAMAVYSNYFEAIASQRYRVFQSGGLEGESTRY